MSAILLALALLFPPAISSGVASYYADPRAPQGSLYAAVPGYRGHPFYATVRRGARSVRVLVMDSCQCYVGTKRERIIDLSWSAFARLAPLSRGLATVTVER